MAAISNQRASPKTAPAFRASQNSFQDYFEFRNGQWNCGFAVVRGTPPSLLMRVSYLLRCSFLFERVFGVDVVSRSMLAKL